MTRISYYPTEFQSAVEYVFRHNSDVFDTLQDARDCLADLINRGASDRATSISTGGFKVCFDREAFEEIHVRIYVTPGLDQLKVSHDWTIGPLLPMRPFQKSPRTRTSAWKRLVR